MAVTPTYSLPYPVDSDPVDVAGDIELLALAVDTALSSAGGGGGAVADVFMLMGA